MDDELFDWLKTASTSSRSMSYIRQNSRSHSFTRLPSISGPFTAHRNSRNISMQKIGMGVGVGVGYSRQHVDAEIKFPSDQDWNDLMRRNKQAQEERAELYKSSTST